MESSSSSCSSSSSSSSPVSLRGLELSRLFYSECVRPLLEHHVPELRTDRYAAALIGTGSEVLGFDDGTSTDHNWGPRVMLFLPEEGGEEEKTKEACFPHLSRKIERVMATHLPRSFRGWSTNWAAAGDSRVPAMQPDPQKLPIDHRVECFSLRSWLRKTIGLADLGELSSLQWLNIPEEQLLCVTAGEVFHDGPGQLTAARQKLQYYPHQVWLYLLGCQFVRLGQEEAFVGRTAMVGDEIGSRILTARLVRDLMRLSFLLERRYAPYMKWFGTAFSKLHCSAALTPHFSAAMKANSYPEREHALCDAYVRVAEQLASQLRLAPSAIPACPVQFHSRPFMVMGADRFAKLCFSLVDDPTLRARWPVGSVDQWVDSTDVLGNAVCFQQLPNHFPSRANDD